MNGRFGGAQSFAIAIALLAVGFIGLAAGEADATSYCVNGNRVCVCVLNCEDTRTGWGCLAAAAFTASYWYGVGCVPPTFGELLP